MRQLACPSLTCVAALLILSLLTVSSALDLPVVPPPSTWPLPDDSIVREFSLKHIFHHGTYKYPDLHKRLDVPETAPVWMVEDDSSVREPAQPLRARVEVMSIQRLVDRSKETIDFIMDWGRMRGKAVQLAAEDWIIEQLPGPNVSDKETVLSFARMASNAYILEPHTGEWKDVGGGFNYTEDFGWETDGLRGHIFADTTNATVVIGLKGTSPALFDGSETTTNDKLNDNLFFSCCCGQGGQYLWREVCDCQTSVYTCNSTCLVGALKSKNRYYHAARELYHNVTALYPNAEIWMAGHSLGGSVSSFLSLTYGHPAVTFEAVPDAMAASRLGLPIPPGHEIGALKTRQNTGGFHFGHTADPIFMGICNQASSICTLGGYAMESVCHTGKKCVYDTVKDFGWRVGIGTHKIVEVIRDVLEKYDEPAKCEQYVNCTDCYPWQFFEGNNTKSSTTSKVHTSTSTLTKTRTETCKTPGWWGCLDESSTSKGSTKTKSGTYPTSTCKTPGWFGCLDEDESTTTAATPSPAPAPSITTTSHTSASFTPSCKHPGWFGGCLDPTNPLTSSSIHTSTPTPPPITTTTCTTKAWFGLICLDGSDEVFPITERMEM